MCEISFAGATVSCILFTATYVGSLYLWRNTAPRDHPSTIKKRFISVACTSLFAAFYMSFMCRNSEQSWNRYVGLHTDSFLLASFLPLLLTMILFLGPLSLLFFDSSLREPFDYDLVWWRNYFVGPLSEEWVFRACMCPLLLAGGYGQLGTLLCSPLFFGVAHLHHIIQHLHKTGRHLRNAWIEVLFQLFYTTIFGMYSAFLFVRTGHLIAPFLAHAFCNYMGFPRFDLVMDHPHKFVVGGCFLAGFSLFWVLLFPITNPLWYNSIFFLEHKM